MQPASDVFAAFMGCMGVGFGGLLGWITFSSVSSALLLGAAGSAGGYLTKLALDYLIKKIKQLKHKKSIK